MPRKQLNLSLTLEQYGWLEEQAEEAGETPTKYARHIVLDAITPAPETDLDSNVLVLPPWLAHFLLFVTRGRAGRRSNRHSRAFPSTIGADIFAGLTHQVVQFYSAPVAQHASAIDKSGSQSAQVVHFTPVFYSIR